MKGFLDKQGKIIEELESRIKVVEIERLDNESARYTCKKQFKTTFPSRYVYIMYMYCRCSFNQCTCIIILISFKFLVTYSSYGCVGDTMTLSCPEKKTINVTSGEYRQRSYPCGHTDVTCCPVQVVSSCAIRLEDIAPQDLVEIKNTCDDKNSCHFTNEERVESMTVWYECLPGKKKKMFSFLCRENCEFLL